MEKVKQYICSSIGLFLTIIDWKIILKNFLSQLNLFGAKNDCVYKLAKVIIINKKKVLYLYHFK